MQSWILDKDFYKSASYLDRNRLQANIYENIQILASLLDVNDKLVNPKRNVKNHPVAKLWSGNENELYEYISVHIENWIKRDYKFDQSTITWKNIHILMRKLLEIGISKKEIPSWVTNELIQTHRSVLIQKEIEEEKELKIKIENLEDAGIYDEKDIDIKNFFLKGIKRDMRKIEKLNHYRKLFPNTPTNLKMRYDFRNEV